MRSLWTAASGMNMQQMQVEAISNNLANVATVSYKQEGVNFKTLLYQNLQTEEQAAQSNNPTPMQVGHGVRLGAISRNFTQGEFMATGNAHDLAIEGNGFFAISMGEDEIGYTRDGSFRLANLDGEGLALVTSDGFPVLSIDGEPITVESGVSTSSIKFDDYGNIFYFDDETGEQVDINALQIVQFANINGLQSIGNNMYQPTGASGVPLLESEEDTLIKSSIKAGYLEGSNVNVATEMINLVVAQRAYEFNSTAIKTADEMLKGANQLKS